MVVTGNPPYSSSIAKGSWIISLIADCKKGLNEKKADLNREEWKFLRFAQWRIEKTGHGIIGFIINNTFLDALTHWRMRQSLLETFDEIYVLNLHGSTNKKERAPDGSKDENVFDIKQGVTVCFFVKLSPKTHCRIFHADVWGLRDNKNQHLWQNDVASTVWATFTPGSPNFFFVPKGRTQKDEYERFWSIADIFQIWQNGLKTDRDELFLDFDDTTLRKRIQQFFANDYDEQFKAQYRVEASSSFDIEARRKQTEFSARNIRRCLYRPFDVRWLYYDPKLTSRPAEKVMRHLLAGANLALITTRQTAQSFDLLCTSHLAGHKSVAAYDINSVFPLYLYGDGHEKPKIGGGTVLMALFEPAPAYGGRRANLNSKFIQDLIQRVRLKWVPVDRGDLKNTVGPEDIFHYAYASFHSPTYRSRYAELLKIDFPRLPLTSDLDLFRALADRGEELVALHLIKSPKLDSFITEFPVKGDNEVEKAQYTDNNQRVWINARQYFGGVPKPVWQSHIGGYQVCERWLRDRKGRKLTYEDIQHYQEIVVALQETIRLMVEIDAAIDKHGGWPIK